MTRFASFMFVVSLFIKILLGGIMTIYTKQSNLLADLRQPIWLGLRAFSRRLVYVIQITLLAAVLISVPPETKAENGFSSTYNFEGNISDASGLFDATFADSVVSADSLALVALYNSTDGPNWTDNTNWLTAPVSQWNWAT